MVSIGREIEIELNGHMGIDGQGARECSLDGEWLRESEALEVGGVGKGGVILAKSTWQDSYWRQARVTRCPQGSGGGREAPADIEGRDLLVKLT